MPTRRAFAKEHFDLQLTFAEKVQAIAGMPLEQALFEYTNFFVRFGLGREPDREHAGWQAYVSGLRDAEDARDYSYRFYLKDAETSTTPPVAATFGCFAYELRSASVARFATRSLSPSLLARLRVVAIAKVVSTLLLVLFPLLLPQGAAHGRHALLALRLRGGERGLVVRRSRLARLRVARGRGTTERVRGHREQQHDPGRRRQAHRVAPGASNGKGARWTRHARATGARLPAGTGGARSLERVDREREPDADASRSRHRYGPDE